MAISGVVIFVAYSLATDTLGGPPPSAHCCQFGAVLGVSAGGVEAFVNVTIQAGPTLVARSTSINLTSTIHPGNFLCAHAGGAGDPYNESAGGIRGGVWTAGETWSLHLVGGPGGTVCGNPPNLTSCGDNVTVMVRDAAQSPSVLFQATLPGTGPLSRCS